MVHRGQELLRPLKRWHFGAFTKEKMMTYSVVDPQDNYGVTNIASDTRILRQYGHCISLDMYELKRQLNDNFFHLSRAGCEFEEAARFSLNTKTPRI